MNPYQLPAELLDRMPPHDLEAEKSVLGCVMLDGEKLEEISFLRPEDFYVDANRKIWRHALALGHDTDILTLRARLAASSELEAAGGDGNLTECLQSVPFAHHALHYAKLVAEMAKRRAVIHTAVAMYQTAWDLAASADEAVTTAESRLGQIDDGRYAQACLPLSEAMITAMQRFDDARTVAGKHGHIYTGICAVDNQFGPWVGGELIILGARTRIGKTSLATQVAKHNARRKRLVYYASMEMDAGELAGRVLCGEARVSRTIARAGKTNDMERSALAEAANANAALPLWIESRPRMSVRDVLRGARRKQKDGLGLVVVDYLQFLEPPDRALKRYEQIGQISRGLKEMSRELDVPVLCVAQVGRSSEQERDGRPGLKHLREGGDIEQDADVVILLHRENAGARKDKGDGTTEYIVEKNRGGGLTGTIRLKWDEAREELVDIEGPIQKEF